jgi:peptidoglycan/xylan/chitin deacetylase (PgdA/CDA1 family)
VDWCWLRSARLVTLMDRQQLADLRQYGIDVQLHTHRHRFPPADQTTAEKEIADNRGALTGLIGDRRFEHLCYPSGVYDRSQWNWLASAGIRSATTCEAGFNYTNTPAFGLRRFLDDSTISAITFEAELCGFLELFRRVRARLNAGFP